MFTVVGSGFGLYGYLPALLEAFEDPVALPVAYRERAQARPELAPYLDRVAWVASPEEALRLSTAVVVATPPFRQPDAVRDCLRFERLATFVVEKPLAPTPELADALLAQLRHAGRRYRVGYTLLHAEWAERLAWPSAGAVTLDWRFMAHHFAHRLDNWKARHADGGGVLRFFGVHAIALLAHHGYRDVARSVLRGEAAEKPEAWEALFAGPGLPDCRVLIDSRSADARFRIAADGRELVALRDPFERERTVGPAGADRRVAVLERLLATLHAPDAPFAALYDHANALWRSAEAASRFEPRRAAPE